MNLKCKIGEFKYINIKHLVNNIRNNTISELSAKKGLNTLNEIKNAEIIKHKKRTSKQKELLNLFNDLSDTILTDKTLMSSKDEDKNEKEKKKGNGNENDETLISSKDDDDDENENEDDETMSQNEKNEIIKEKKWCFRRNNWQIKIIWRANKIAKKTRGSKRVLAL